ncbi:MAG: hypothetical protein ACFBSC_21220 [Microcoleaceae cyanobacterium]
MDSQAKHLQDDKLKQLALTAQQYPDRSPERREALSQLVSEIWHSGRLRHPHPGQFPDRYQEIYEIALQNLMFYICNSIDRYEPTAAPVMRWVNFLLERRFFPEAVTEVLGNRPTDLPRASYEETQPAKPPESQPSLSDLIQQVNVEDLGGIFASKSIRGYPEANFKTLFKRRIIEQESWKAISKDLGIKISTLSEFYQRCLKQFATQIKQDIQT